MRKIFVWMSVAGILFAACGHSYTPHPRGYYRIAFPQKAYKKLELQLPYTFELPVYAQAGPDLMSPDQKEWITLDWPANHAQVHLSYKKIDHNLDTYLEESRSLAYKHTQKASAIEEELFVNPDQRVYGTIYTIRGNAASPLQFYLTDSLHHFLRGSLYIREVPNIDSLQPVVTFLSQDVLHLIKTTTWRENH